MLLVDFGERSYKFAACKKAGQDMRVDAWGIEDMRSLEYGTESILKKVGEIQDAGPTLLSFPPGMWQAKTFYERIERRDANLRITLVEKEEILEELSRAVRIRLGENMQGSSGILAKDVIIEKLAVLGCSVDGYEVPDILGFQGSCVDFRCLCVFTLVAYRTTIDAISQKFQSSGIFHLVQAIQGFSETKRQDGVYVDMGDDSTQIVLVKDQKIVFVDRIQCAGKDFTLFLQETLVLGANTARDFEERYIAGDFSFPLRERVKGGFLGLAKELLGLVQKSLQEVATSLPPSVYIFGGTSKFPEVQEVFQGASLHDLAFSQEPRVSFLLPKDLWTLAFPEGANPSLTPLFLLPYANKENS